VEFGSNAAQSFKQIETGLGCGSTTTLEAISPKGTSGAKVPVTVATEESYFTGTGDAPMPAGFTYEG
jgi:hypothetical protein